MKTDFNLTVRSVLCSCVDLLGSMACDEQDDGSWPVPPVESMVKSFNTKLMDGRWYISAGLNPAFDCFDCQVSGPALRVALRNRVLVPLMRFLRDRRPPPPVSRVIRGCRMLQTVVLRVEKCS